MCKIEGAQTKKTFDAEGNRRWRLGQQLLVDDEELRALATNDLKHELTQLVNLAELLLPAGKAAFAALPKPARIVWVESYAVHVRNLIEFLHTPRANLESGQKGKKEPPKARTLVAEDFLRAASEWKATPWKENDELRPLFDQASREVSHLSAARVESKYAGGGSGWWPNAARVVLSDFVAFLPEADEDLLPREAHEKALSDARRLGLLRSKGAGPESGADAAAARAIGDYEPSLIATLTAFPDKDDNKPTPGVRPPRT